MGRIGKKDYPPNMTTDGRNGFYVRNPLTGKRKRFSDEAKARAASATIAVWVASEKEVAARDGGKPTFAVIVAEFLRDRAPYLPWSKGTRANYAYKFAGIVTALGTRVPKNTDCVFLDNWLNTFCISADNHTKWRHALVLIYEYAISRRYANENEAEKILERSASKKLEVNQKVRRPLDVASFKAIHAKADPWLRLAMELSLLTLQARNEIVNLKHTDFRNGHLFVIRKKVSGESDWAFIKIQQTAELDGLRSRGLLLDSTISPYVVHRKPHKRARKTQGEPLPHWTYITPGYLSKAFQKARDAAGVFADRPVLERPTFHEIRGLGSRLARERGTKGDAIRALMAHSDAKTTAIYLDGGVEALTDANYFEVAPCISLNDALR